LTGLADGYEGAGTSAADGCGLFPEDVRLGDAPHAQIGEGSLTGRGLGDDEANPRRRSIPGFIGGVDADAAAAQLPGDVRGAVFVFE
jgi:hypothetical protein